MIVIVRLFKKIYTSIIALQFLLITKNYLCSSTTWFKADAKMCQKNNIVLGQFKISFYLNDFAKKGWCIITGRPPVNWNFFKVLSLWYTYPHKIPLSPILDKTITWEMHTCKSLFAEGVQCLHSIPWDLQPSLLNTSILLGIFFFFSWSMYFVKIYLYVNLEEKMWLTAPSCVTF